MIDISPSDEAIVNEILKKYVPDCEVRVFGSRHKWTAKSYSDLDLAIVGDTRLDKKVLYALQEAFEDSELSFRVGVLDWHAISDEFRAIIEQGYSVIQEAENKLPDGWAVKKLGDIIKIIGGGTPKTSNPDYWNGAIPWLSVKDFNNDTRYVFNTEKSITELGLLNSSTKMLSKDDIIISARGTVGEIAQLARDMAFNQSCYGVKANAYSCNDFIYYLLKYKVAELKSKAHGSVFDTITRATFDNLEINLPPLEQQKEIATILSSLDDKIELNQQINKKLEEMAQAIFKEWFIDFNFPDENGNPYRDSGGAMIDSELGQIPAYWSVGKLSSIVDFYNGYAFKSGELKDNSESGSYHVLKMGHIKKGGGLNRNGTRSYVFKTDYSKLSKYILKIGDLCMCMTDMKGSVALLGHTALIDEDDKYIVNQRVGLLRIKNKNSYNYPLLYLLTNHYLFLESLRAKANSGVQVNLSSEVIKNSLVVLPTIKLHLVFNNIAEQIYNSIFNNQNEIDRLSSIRDTLLPKLMSGEIKI